MARGVGRRAAPNAACAAGTPRSPGGEILLRKSLAGGLGVNQVPTQHASKPIGADWPGMRSIH